MSKVTWLPRTHPPSPPLSPALSLRPTSNPFPLRDVVSHKVTEKLQQCRPWHQPTAPTCYLQLEQGTCTGADGRCPYCPLQILQLSMLWAVTLIQLQYVPLKHRKGYGKDYSHWNDRNEEFYSMSSSCWFCLSWYREINMRHKESIMISNTTSEIHSYTLNSTNGTHAKKNVVNILKNGWSVRYALQQVKQVWPSRELWQTHKLLQLLRFFFLVFFCLHQRWGGGCFVVQLSNIVLRSCFG